MASEVKLGEVPDLIQDRDAVHVAVIPCVAGCDLSPGQHVDVECGTAIPRSVRKLGIVDPFRVGTIAQGERCYVCLYPGSVNGMRHHWRHPAFDGDADESEKWLRRYAAEKNCYDEPERAFQRLIEGLRTGSLFFYGSDLHGFHDIRDDADELRVHAESYLGISIDWSDFQYSCSC